MLIFTGYFSVILVSRNRYSQWEAEMKNLFVLFIPIIIISQFYFIAFAQEVGPRGWRTGEMQIRISIENPERINMLYN